MAQDDKPPVPEIKPAKAASGTKISPPDSEKPNDPALSVTGTKADEKGDTVDPPPAVMDATTQTEVKKVPVPDQTRAARVLPRERQHPSLTEAKNGEAIEVAERTIDIDTTSGQGSVEATVIHVKDFVTTRREWESEDHDAVHTRNFRAVRQYMVNQGIRPDADVVLMDVVIGDPPRRGREDLASVVLRYGVKAIPAVVAVGMEQVHTVIDQNGPTATQLAEYQAAREERIRASHAALIGS